MKKTRIQWPALCCILAGMVLLHSCADPKPEEIKAAYARLPDKVDFNLHIKPLLSDRCFACHGPDKNKQKAGLRLDIPEVAYAALKDGAHAIVPGHLRASELFRRITSKDPQKIMPPVESNLRLSNEEKALLCKWIEQGAEYKPHWSFIPPQKPPLPVVRDKAWPRNGIDYFVMQKMEAHHLRPAPAADKTTLLRRVTFDLTGLPPTPEEIDSFLADQSPHAYEKVVDRLLASPAYGERMAVDWLDLARYADTHGYQDDGLRTMWPYRDWVINAFNKNLPFDQFITWQLAGDLLPHPTLEQLIATAFNRNHQQSQEGGIIPEEYRTEYVIDRVNTFGKAFMGLTVECARCHDHKYDPISQKDFYSLYAFFNNVNERGQIPYNGEPSPTITLPTPTADSILTFIRQQIGQTDQALRPQLPEYQQGFQQWLEQAGHNPVKALLPAHKGLIAKLSFEDHDTALVYKNEVNRRHKVMVWGDKDKRPVAIAGPYGKARQLIGDSYINFGDKFGFFERNQPFTVSMWLKFLKDKDKGVFACRSGGFFNGDRGYEYILLEDRRLKITYSYVWPGNCIDLETQEKVPLNQWFQLTVSYDGTSKASGVQVYLNGKRAAVDVINDHLTQSLIWGKNRTSWGGLGNWQIGQVQDVNMKDFAIDEFLLYNRALTPLEASSLYSRKDEVLQALQTPTAHRSRDQQAALYQYYLTNVNVAYRKRMQEVYALLGKETEVNEKQIDLMIMQERKYPRKTYILHRGVYDAPTTEVTPNTPEKLLAFPTGFPHNRLGLAKWLLHPNHPLTARVAVNRYWQMYFGNGLVKTSDDFGSQGELPSHPELLDWLAVRFRESGWNIKAMQKLIVMSATYCQSSKVSKELLEQDPDNRLLARGPSFRLPAEMIRDNALAASGLLVKKIGGPSVYPYQPPGLWEALATRNATTYRQQHGDSLYRRSLYTVWKRSSPPPSMLNFDSPERAFCVVRRQKTSTPLQSLVLLNDPQYVEAARVLAEKMIRICGAQNTDACITYAFRCLTSRLPRSEELSILRKLYQAQLAFYRQQPKEALALLGVGEYPRDKKIDPVLLAANTIVASTIMNFDEAVIKR